MAAIVSLALALVFALPGASAGQAEPGAVSRAIADERAGCTDGLGRLRSFAEADAAPTEEIQRLWFACKTMGTGTVVGLGAVCSPVIGIDWGVELGRPASGWTACVASVEHVRGDVTINQDEFRLVAADGRTFEPSGLTQALELNALVFSTDRTVTEQTPYA